MGAGGFPISPEEKGLVKRLAKAVVTKELTERQIKNIKKRVDKGESLDKILPKSYPHALIAIVRGYDNFEGAPYTKDAYFNARQASEEMVKIPPNGTLPDTYHVVTGSVEDIEEGQIFDRRTGRPLDHIDVSMVYDDLEERLKKYK
ncbi:hypothetical protein KY349_05255 [Candidatus Woesearchaeota archaeon]|nr:hypothetical protein [Candidatus Woesearchaeota archaeon]